VPEREIIKFWRYLSLNSGAFITEEGDCLKIIYPGRVNHDGGADFRDAVITTAQGLMKGDIEVHVNSADWQAHQHHLNPDYNRVILHVAMWHNTGAPTNLQNGKDIPVIALHKYLIDPSPEKVASMSLIEEVTKDFFGGRLSMPCLKVRERLTTNDLAKFLDRAGEERFLAKAASFQADLAQMEAGQTLYQGIMGALGYSKNKLPFLELAQRMPLQILESVTREKISDEECLAQEQALLFGTAGLLPSQRPDRHRADRLDKWVNQLELLWASSGYTEAMSPSDWHLFKVRPNNFPIRRIAAMSYLLLCHKERGVFEELVNTVKQAPADKHCLGRGLAVATNGYWASHLDFGLESRIRNPVLLGASRAAEMMVNVILPFTLAWSQLASLPELGQQALDLYRHYPRLAVNAVERHMREQLGLSGLLVNSARRQQGLIHIYNALCTQGRCNSCTLGTPYL
jgi:hypothetical protein